MQLFKKKKKKKKRKSTSSNVVFVEIDDIFVNLVIAENVPGIYTKKYTIIDWLRPQ